MPKSNGPKLFVIAVLQRAGIGAQHQNNRLLGALLEFLNFRLTALVAGTGAPLPSTRKQIPKFLTRTVLVFPLVCERGSEERIRLEAVLSIMIQQFDGVPISSIEGIRIVHSLREMGDILANGNWPSDGPKFLAALAALVEERVGRCSAANARIAFISAAMEADVLPASFLKD